MATTLWDPPLEAYDGQIRLLRLLPRLGSAEIRCELIVANLDEVLQYEALSYEWGSSKSSLRTINVNGESISVRENLWLALWYLAFDEEPRVLWVDAVCVSKENVSERNSQVSQIGRIINQALRVIAWIGDLEPTRITSQPTSPITELRLASFGFAQDDIDPAQAARNCTAAALSHLQRATRASVDQPGNVPALSGLSADSLVWEGLELLCQRRYWSRLWTLSELLMAYDIVIQCGDNSFSWKSLDELVILARSTYIGLPRNAERAARLKASAFQRLSIHRHRTLTQQDPPALSDLVLNQYGPHFNCSETLDKVYGLHCISADCCKQAIPIDYSISLQQLCSSLIIHHYAYHASIGSVQDFDIIHAFYYLLWPESLVGWGPSPFSVVHEPAYIFTEFETGNRWHEFNCQNRGVVTWISGPINLSKTTRIFQLRPMDRPRPVFNASVRTCIETFILWQKSLDAAREIKPVAPHPNPKKRGKSKGRAEAGRPSSAPATTTEFGSKARRGSTNTRETTGKSPSAPSPRGVTSPGGQERKSSFKRFFSRDKEREQEDEEADEALWHEWLQLMDQKEETKRADLAQRLLLTDKGTITLSPPDIQIGDRVWDFTPEWDGILVTRGEKPCKVIGLTHMAFEKVSLHEGKDKMKLYANQSTLVAMARYLIR